MIQINTRSGRTPQQIIDSVEAVVADLTDVTAAGVQYLGQPELAALVRLAGDLVKVAGKLVEDGIGLVEQPTPQQVLTSEVDAADVAADAAEKAKVGA